MSDDKLDLKLNVDVDVHDADKAKALRKEFARIDAELTAIGRHTTESLKALGMLARAAAGLRSKGSSADTGARAAVEGERDLYQELKRRFAFERRMASQRKAEESDAVRAAREEAREVESRFRAQMAWNTRIAAQRAREEKAAESEIQREVRETGRIRDKEARKALADAKALQSEQAKAQAQAAAQINRGAGQVRGGVGRAVVAGGAGAAATVYAANRTVADLTRAGVSLDKAVNANVRLSGLDPKAADAKGKDLVRQSAPIARQIGIKTSEYLMARSEALQAGVDDAIVDAVTEFGSKYARLNDIAPSEVMESSGYGITALGAFGKVTADKVKQLFNTQKHLAATTAASRTGLSSFVRRGLSSGEAAGFSLEDTLAYGGAATSSGADGESAARMLSSTTERLASMPTRAAGIARKKHKSPKDQLILQLPKKLGFNTWKELKQSFSQDAAGSVEKIYEGLAAITDPRARLEASEEIWGKEFGSVHAAMAVGHRFRDMRKSVRSTEAGNAINSGMSIRSGSFDFIMDQIGSTFQSLKDGLGMVLEPSWKDLRDWAIQTPKAFESFDLAFKEGLTGFLTGLGSPDGSVAGLLKSWFGDPTSFTVNAKAIGDFARGVGQGIRDIGAAIVGFVRLFAGRDASPEEMGKWSARILGLSAALLVAAPAVAVLGGLATAISGFSTIVLGVWGAMKAAGLVGATGTGAVPKIAGTVAGGGLVGRALSWFSRLAPAMAMPLTTDASKEDQDRLTKRLGAFSLEMEKQRKAIEKNTESLDTSAKIQKQSYETNSAGFAGLIHKAAFSSVGDAVNNAVRSTARAAVSGSVGSGGSEGPALNESIPGKSISGMGGRRRGIIGGGAGSANAQFSGSNSDAVKQAAANLGISPKDLATIISYETGGTFDPSKRGGKGGRHQGLIQFGPAERAKYGVTGNETFPQQMQQVERFLRDRGVKPGMGLDKLYATVNGGNPNASQGLSDGNGTIGSHVAKMQAEHSARAQAFLDAQGSGGSGGGPVAKAGDGQSTGHLDGKIQLEGETYDFGSGGHRGANSIPFGTHKITPGTIGPWGQAHGALGIAGNAIWDRTLGRMRTGIEFHAASSASKLSAGCVAIARSQYGKFRAHVLDYVRRNGEAYLTVGADGRASITSAADRLKADTAKTQDLAREAGKPPASLAPKPTDCGDDLAVHPGATSSAIDINKIPPRASGGRGGSADSGGSGHTIHQTVQINGYNQSPQELSGQVQRHLQDAMNRRTHDYDGFA